MKEETSNKKMTDTLLFAWENNPRIDFVHTANYVTDTDDPKSFPLHMHTLCELYVFVSGNADYIVESNRFHMQPGDVILTQPNELHRVQLLSQGEYECFYMKIPLDSFEALNENAKPLHCFLDRRSGEKNHLRMNEEDRIRLLKICNLFIQEKNFPNENSRLLCISYVFQLLALVNGAYERENATNPKGVVLTPLMRDILNYVNDNLTTIKTAEQVANKFFITPAYFSKMFCNTMGVPFVKYLRTKKITLAKIHLMKGDSVTTACYESGFSDYSYFIATFHKETGMTPLQYQKKKYQDGGFNS